MFAPHRPRVLLGFSGSVATIKARELCAAVAAHADVRVIFTQAALHFVSAADLDDIRRLVQHVHTDADEWPAEWRRGDAVLHIELRKWVDVFVIAPLSANSLSKLANGACDNLLLCVARAWEYGDRARTLLVAPAMNTAMWSHPATRTHLDAIAQWGVLVVPPVSKLLACGDLGVGAMAGVDTIDAAIRSALAAPRGGGSVTSSGAVPTPSLPRLWLAVAAGALALVAAAAASRWRSRQ